MRIDRSDLADGPGEAHMDRSARSAHGDTNVAGRESGKEISGDGAPGPSAAHSEAALRTERSVAYRADVDAAYLQYAVDHGYAEAERPERETVTPEMPRLEDEGRKRGPVRPEDRVKGKGRLAEAADLERGQTPQPPGDTTAATAATAGGSTPGDGGHEFCVVAGSCDSYSAYRTNEDVPTLVGGGGDVPDDPRNYSNPKTGRSDASWSTYDRAISAARQHIGGDLGADSIKMYDRNPETGEGTGTLIGEQTRDRLRGWRIDGRDGHVNWWEWTGGKKGAGGVYGHDWFPEDASTPGSRYIGWAPWQDSDGNVLEGN